MRASVVIALFGGLCLAASLCDVAWPSSKLIVSSANRACYSAVIFAQHATLIVLHMLTLPNVLWVLAALFESLSFALKLFFAALLRTIIAIDDLAHAAVFILHTTLIYSTDIVRVLCAIVLWLLNGIANLVFALVQHGLSFLADCIAFASRDVALWSSTTWR